MEQEKLIGLVKKAQNGDSTAVEQLLVHAHTAVSYQCRKFMNSPEDAEDMTQEVLMVIYQKLDTLTDPAAFNGWVKRIAATRCMNAVSRTHVDLQFAEDEEGNSVLDTIEELDAQKVPEAALDNAETSRMVVELIDALPEAQRICTYLYYYNELSIKEIAELTAATENTVKSRLNYARKAIKEGVLEHEKKGVKLYGLSPLPFLVYFLWKTAQTEANSAAAASCVTGVMAANAATAATAAAATTAATTTTTTATTATTATAVSGKVAGGVAGFLSKKLIAGVLAGVLTLGGGAVATVQLVNRHAETVPAIICRHEWEDADCTTPKTCGKCDSVEGEALGHVWMDADCEHPQTCQTCSATEGEALGHTWTEATCETAQICQTCAAVGAEALGHDMAEANYQQPATCKTCGYIEGEALPAEYESCGLDLIYAEMGKEYDYLTTCYDNEEFKTVGKLVLSGYEVFTDGEGCEALEGYEWHTVTATITFCDDNAWNYGFSITSFWDDYYIMRIWGDSADMYTVNYNGVEYDQCIYTGKLEIDKWDRETRTCIATVTQKWRVPVGYDGHLIGFRDSSTTYTAGQHLNEFVEETALIFRFIPESLSSGSSDAEEETTAPNSDDSSKTEIGAETTTPEGGQGATETDVQNTATVPPANDTVTEEDHTGMFLSLHNGWVKHDCGTEGHIYNDGDCEILQEMTCTQPKIYRYTCRVVGCDQVEIKEKESYIRHYRSLEDATACVDSWSITLFDYNNRTTRWFYDEEAMKEFVRYSVAAYQNGTSAMWVQEIMYWQRYEGPSEYVCQTCGLTYHYGDGEQFYWNGDEALTRGVVWKNSYTPDNQPSY